MTPTSFILYIYNFFTISNVLLLIFKYHLWLKHSVLYNFSLITSYYYSLVMFLFQSCNQLIIFFELLMCSTIFLKFRQTTPSKIIKTLETNTRKTCKSVIPLYQLFIHKKTSPYLGYSRSFSCKLLCILWFGVFIFWQK